MSANTKMTVSQAIFVGRWCDGAKLQERLEVLQLLLRYIDRERSEVSGCARWKLSKLCSGCHDV